MSKQQGTSTIVFGIIGFFLGVPTWLQPYFSEWLIISLIGAKNALKVLLPFEEHIPLAVKETVR